MTLSDFLIYLAEDLDRLEQVSNDPAALDALMNEKEVSPGDQDVVRSRNVDTIFAALRVPDKNVVFIGPPSPALGTGGGGPSCHFKTSPLSQSSFEDPAVLLGIPGPLPQGAAPQALTPPARPSAAGKPRRRGARRATRRLAGPKKKVSRKPRKPSVSQRAKPASKAGRRTTRTAVKKATGRNKK